MKKEQNGFKINFDLIIEVSLLIAVVITPIIFDRRLGIVFSGTKIAWLRTIMIVAMALWAGKLIILKEHKWLRSPLDWPVVTFLLTTTIATLTSVHVYTSFVGFYGRFEGLSTWYLYGLLFFLTTNFITGNAQLKRIIAAVVSASTLMSIYSIIQRQELDPYMWGGVITWQRVIGTIGQPNFIAAYVLMAFFLSLVLLLEDRKYSEKIDWLQQAAPLGYFIFGQLVFLIMIYTLDAGDILVWYFGFALITAGALMFAFTYEKLHPLVLDILLGATVLLSYVCLLYTQSRGGYMGFFSAAVIFGLVAGRQWIFKHWQKLSILVALIVLISAYTMLKPEYSPFERFTGEIAVKSAESVDESASSLELKGAAGSRGETWKSGFKIIADNPFFGIGPEVLKFVFPRYETDLFRYKEAFHVKQDRNHNEIFDISVTKGLISFFVYLWIIGLFFKLGFEKSQDSSDHDRLILAGLLAAALAYLVQNQFSFGVVAITSLFWVIWGMVTVVGHQEEAKSTTLIPINEVGSIPWLPLAGVVTVALLLVWPSFFSFTSDINFKTGKTLMEMRRFPEASVELKKSLAVTPFEGTTISHLAIVFMNTGNSAEAGKYLIYGTQVDPFNADNFFMLARLNLSLYDSGDQDAYQRGLDYANIALKIDPYYAEAYETKGILAERRGDINEAYKMYKKTFEVNQTLPGPMKKFIELAKRTGNYGDAQVLVRKAAQRFPDNLDLFKAREQLK